MLWPKQRPPAWWDSALENHHTGWLLPPARGCLRWSQAEHCNSQWQSSSSSPLWHSVHVLSFLSTPCHLPTSSLIIILLSLTSKQHTSRATISFIIPSFGLSSNSFINMLLMHLPPSNTWHHVINLCISQADLIVSPPVPCHSNSPTHFAARSSPRLPYRTQQPPLIIQPDLQKTHLRLSHNWHSLHFSYQWSLGMKCANSKEHSLSTQLHLLHRFKCLLHPHISAPYIILIFNSDCHYFLQNPIPESLHLWKQAPIYAEVCGFDCFTVTVRLVRDGSYICHHTTHFALLLWYVFREDF